MYLLNTAMDIWWNFPQQYIKLSWELDESTWPNHQCKIYEQFKKLSNKTLTSPSNYNDQVQLMLTHTIYEIQTPYWLGLECHFWDRHGILPKSMTGSPKIKCFHHLNIGWVVEIVHHLGKVLNSKNFTD